MKRRTFDELAEILDEYDIVLTLPINRYIVTAIDTDYTWKFDNLNEVNIFVTGFEFALENWQDLPWKSLTP